MMNSVLCLQDDVPRDVHEEGEQGAHREGDALHGAEAVAHPLPDDHQPQEGDVGPRHWAPYRPRDLAHSRTRPQGSVSFPG